ncbi:5'-nucleotidase, lipoprotein e(P4) family [Plesiocystis pacifica]|uniref:5'-nucleotidase, lipoprotein e(P4) family n=1 Tax=Plesiocystis pacifica TaxID=191768 RepID=UPI000A30D21A|nr:HAD family acid phosphatase [Plesiocystis pacifica]
MVRSRRVSFTLVALAWLPACTHAHPKLTATLYGNTAAEHHASTRAIYMAAKAQLPAALADTTWTAALEQGEGAGDKPAAIILDVDETVLDNSPYQVQGVQGGPEYPDGWDAWCKMESAEPVAGAVEFTRFAASQGVTVFYVTNRDSSLESCTHANLVAAGFPMAEGVDVVLTKNERPEWTGDKTTRRAFVAEDYRIVMLFGDQLGDFTGEDEATTNPSERDAVVDAHAQRWGSQWFVLPNPLYGGWDSVTYGHDFGLSEDEKNARRLRSMHGPR